jgi:hypothetical protein
MSWPELIFYGTIVIGIVGAPFLLLSGLYGFMRHVIEHVRRRETGSVPPPTAGPLSVPEAATGRRPARSRSSPSPRRWRSR